MDALRAARLQFQHARRGHRHLVRQSKASLSPVRARYRRVLDTAFHASSALRQPPTGIERARVAVACIAIFWVGDKASGVIPL